MVMIHESYLHRYLASNSDEVQVYTLLCLQDKRLKVSRIISYNSAYLDPQWLSHSSLDIIG